MIRDGAVIGVFANQTVIGIEQIVQNLLSNAVKLTAVPGFALRQPAA